MKDSNENVNIARKVHNDEDEDRIFLEWLEFLMGVPKDSDGETIIKNWNETRIHFIENPNAFNDIDEFTKAHWRFIDYVKFDFYGKELTLSLLLFNEIKKIMQDLQNPSEIVSFFDDLIDCLEREIDKKSRELKIEELHWIHLLDIIRISDDKMRMSEFYKYFGNEKLLKESLIFFSENEELNRIFNGLFFQYCICHTQQIIQILFFTRNCYYLKKTGEKYLSEYLPYDESEIHSLELLFKRIDRDPLKFYKTEKDLVRLFSKLISKEFLSKYVIGLDDKNNKHNFTKIQSHHLIDHFRKSIIRNGLGIDLNENDIEDELKKIFHCEKNDTLIKIERDLKNTYFIWEGSELHLAYLFSELTEREIINGLELNKKKKIVKNQYKENNKSTNDSVAAKSNYRNLIDRTKSKDNSSSFVIDAQEEIYTPQVDWKGNCSHFMIVKDGVLKKIDYIQMGKQGSNLKKSDKSKRIINNQKNGIGKNYNKKQNKKNTPMDKNEENEYREIDRILDEIFGPRTYTIPDYLD